MLRVAAFLVLTACAPAHAQTPPECGGFDTVVEDLATNWGESPYLIALDPRGRTYIFFGNPNTESWTIVLLRGTCASQVASGFGYQQSPSIPGVDN